MDSHHFYGYETRDFTTGERVAVHPATDHFMRGDKYGTVVKVWSRFLSVELDSGRRTRISPSNITKVS